MNRMHRYLDPRWPMGVDPVADRNVDHVGSCCLDVNGKAAYIMKGRGGGARFMIWFIVAVGGPAILAGLYIGQVIEGFGMALLIALAFGLSLLWPIHVWRTHLPVRFNRKTRKVYFHHKGKTYVSDWDTIRAYLKVQAGVAAGGAPLRDPQVNIEFDDGKGGSITVFLMASDKLLSGPSFEEKAAQLWEYIRVYMEEGPDRLPKPEPEFKDASLKGIIRDNNPFPGFGCKNILCNLLLEVPLMALSFVLFFIHVPTDLLYYQLAKRIKMKPYPPEMVEACVCEEDKTAETDDQINIKEVMA